MKNLYHAALILLLTVILISLSLAEIRSHFIERFVGSYMNSSNEDRERFERFVDQEIRTNQALEHAKKLIDQRGQEDVYIEDKSGDQDDKLAQDSEFVRMDRGHKLIMSRTRLLKIPNWYTQVDSSLALQPLFKPDTLLQDWTRSIVIRPGWIRKGAVYMVDDNNYILHQIPLSVERFNLIDAYASVTESRLRELMDHVFQPRHFFDTLRSLDTEIRDEIIDPLQFNDLEATAQRVGVSEEQGIIQIEQFVNGKIDVVTIPISADLFVELYVALGAL